ncbi:MAG: SDR family oxidoreductase [Cyclobacteriaceae bacterium]|nr:SDR family oxidoreductase [Cyclobacteriaceae bacterium]
MKYHQKVVVITGAAQGIGRALAMSYAHEGAHVVAIDKNEHSLMQTCRGIEKNGHKAMPLVMELSKVQDIEKGFSTIASLLRRVDVLINNAGLSINKPIFELSIDEWDYVMHSNLRAAFVCAREAARLMNPTGGSIVNIASTRALMSEPDTFAYSASKGGLLSLTHALAISLGTDNIRVNAISPGWIEAENYPGLKSTDHAQHPAGRVGKPNDVAKACHYLTDPDNDFLTGINLVIDGGMTHKMIYEE